MKIFDFKKTTKGWFIGNFANAVLQTADFEVSYKLHKKNEKWDTHYHTQVTEVNLIIRGKMIIQGKTLTKDDIFVIEPYEIADPVFLEDTEIVCVKTPSINDKVVVKIV